MDRKVYCNTCGTITNHIVKAEHKVAQYGWRDGLDDVLLGSFIYQVIECSGCNTISFRKRDFKGSYIEDIDLDYYEYNPERDSDGVFDEDVSDLKERLKIEFYEKLIKDDTRFLSEENGKKVIRVHHSYTDTLYPERTYSLGVSYKKIEGVPQNIDKLYKDVVSCFNQQINILCAVGLRAIIEEICNVLKIAEEENSLKEKISRGEKITLAEKIEALSRRRKIGIEHSLSLKALKFLGDRAVHNLEIPDKQELLFAIDVLEQAMRILFELPKKHSQIKGNITNRVSE